MKEWSATKANATNRALPHKNKTWEAIVSGPAILVLDRPLQRRYNSSITFPIHKKCSTNEYRGFRLTIHLIALHNQVLTNSNFVMSSLMCVPVRVRAFACVRVKYQKKFAILLDVIYS